jgi:hypothetical protein
VNKFYFAKGKIRYKGEWIVVEAPYDIVNYYKWWVEKFIWKKISTSYHKPHITVLAGKHEKGLDKHPLWGKYEGKEVEFKYFSRIETDDRYLSYGRYFWLRVECPFLAQLRTELGLKPFNHWLLRSER